jgi:hypothetical protein
MDQFKAPLLSSSTISPTNLIAFNSNNAQEATALSQHHITDCFNECQWAYVIHFIVCSNNLSTPFLPDSTHACLHGHQVVGGIT